MLAFVASLLMAGLALELPGEAGLYVCALGHAVLGVWVFLTHGGRHITATGVYFLSAAVFGGVGTAYAAMLGEFVDVELAIQLLAYVLVAHGAIQLAVAYRAALRRAAQDEGEQVAGTTTAFVLGWVLLASGLIVGERLGPIGGAAAYDGVLLLGAAVLWSPNLGTVLGRGAAWLMVGGATLLFLAVAFHGHGRLNAASLMLAFLIVGGGRAAWGRWWKVAVVAGVFPMLIVSGMSRLALRDSGDATAIEWGSGAAASAANEGGGLGSLYSPVRDFVAIVKADEYGRIQHFSRRYGGTFVDALLAPVPRVLWPDKPEGLGRVLVHHLAPEVRHPGHSLAGTAWAEWFINFGWWGIVVMVPCTALALIVVDAMLARRTRGTPRTFEELIWAVAVAVLAAGMTDYFWVGTFTYHARAGIRVYVLIGIVLWLRANQWLGLALRRSGS